MKRCQAGRGVAAFVLTLLLGCSRGSRDHESSASAPPQAASTPQASPAVPALASVTPKTEAAAPEPQLTLRREPIISASGVGDVGAPKRFRVMVTWPLAWHQPGIDEQVAEIGFPNTCEAFAADATRPWRVTCTPRYRKPVAEAFVEAGEVVLRVLPEGGAERLVRAPLNGHPFAPVSSEVDSRATPCPANVERKRELNVTLPSANWLLPYTPATIFYLAVPGSPPFALINEHGWWQGCKPQRLDDAIKIACANGRHAAQISVEGPSIRFDWQDQERYAGRILLPCDAHAVLAKPNFSEGYRYR